MFDSIFHFVQWAFGDAHRLFGLFGMAVIIAISARIFSRERKLREDLASGKLDITCQQCRKLASPIEGTPDRYRCKACGSQFVGPAHEA
jgi:hypothetical protein